MYRIEVETFYEHFYQDKELFEFSNYTKDLKHDNNANNVVVGKMKDETCGVIVKGFVELKPKIYTFITEDNHKSKKVKGIIKMLLMMN